LDPIATIGLCVRNAEKTIVESVGSIVAQDYPHEFLRLILVDDGCRDRTIDLAKEELAKSDIKVTIMKVNGRGLGAARQTVVENAEGKYIIWIDGDITVPKDHVRKQVEFMESNYKLGKARAHWEKYEGGNLVARLENFQVLDYGKGYSTLRGIGGSVFRTAALRQIGGFDRKIRGAGEDIDVDFRLKLAGWNLALSSTTFHHAFRESWSKLWEQYYWYGQGGHYVLHKNPQAFQKWHRIPTIAFFIGVLYSVKAYKSSRKKVAFLLPLQFLFKNTAWCLGFLDAHSQKYQS
jgi:glycosyltransferase involved in cell wall biosynthesis